MSQSQLALASWVWTHELILPAGNVGNVHVMGRRAEIFQLLSSEDVDRNKMNLGVPVFPSLRGRHLHDLAGAALDHNESVLPQSGALHRISGRGARVDTLKGVLMLDCKPGQSSSTAVFRSECAPHTHTRRWGRTTVKGIVPAHRRPY